MGLLTVVGRLRIEAVVAIFSEGNTCSHRAPIVVNVFYHTASKIVWVVFSLYFFGLLLDAS